MNLQDISRHYISTTNCELAASVVAQFRQFILDLAQVELQGINCQYVDYVPYLRGDQLCLEDIHADFNQGILKICNQFNNSELLGPEVNMIFRCIHEVHHLQLNVGFGLEGEFATAAHIISLTDNLLFKQILFSETLGQVAVCLCEGNFPEHQKVILYPPEVIYGLNKGWQPLI
ncbi:hypothetical protein [Limnofasciculus baicalensis]|uniref:Uncharacterized protein n=1 Tax=Limnofasciculus baicalensis BBK-W-15 TaxID=2699891 RepID=A0AAE3GUI2_9CYAN|nr:hypothetical protein [Limnofasciculus baicalensis]MCP2728812.1 hypothetical protein [Limnofasciculus baicalensis BBK-W-15]